ncbi:MAG: DUF6497 family protein [Pseudooceanicola sp.]
MRLRLVNIVAAGGAFLCAATTVSGQEEAPTVPSGIALTLQEVREETDPAGNPVVRFRYVALELANVGFARVEGDFDVICKDQVLPWVALKDPLPKRAVISMASAPVEFGATAPDVTQYFEVYRLENGSCIWEGL